MERDKNFEGDHGLSRYEPVEKEDRQDILNQETKIILVRVADNLA
jgi:hypothetical protein